MFELSARQLSNNKRVAYRKILFEQAMKAWQVSPKMLNPH
jgi:hypothetical protein